MKSKKKKKGAFCIFCVGLCRDPDWQIQPWLGLVQALAEQQVTVLLVAVTQRSSVRNV